MTDTKLAPHECTPPVSVVSLFAVCLKIGLLSFGGGLSAWLHREFVERKSWISEDDFASTLAISQMLPGANVVNLVVCLGEQLKGLVGAVVCMTGFLAGPFFAVIGLSSLIDHIGKSSFLDTALSGVAAAATGLLIVMCWKGVRRTAQSHFGVAVAVAVSVGILDLPILVVAACLAPLSVWISWRRSADDA
jgi:chromate transporter